MTEAAVQEPEQKTDTPAQPPAGENLPARANAAASIGFGMNARNWEEGFRIANQLAKSNLVPKAFHEKPQDIVVAMQLGAELGLPPMQSLQSIAVINGRPGVYGDGFLAVIMSSPSYAKHAEYFVVAGERREFLSSEDLKQPDTAAVSSFWRKGNADPFTATFSVADAQRAGLLSKDGPWKQYPARMLKLRARGFAGRDAFAGELRGMKTAEELGDINPELPPDPIDAPPAEPMRRSEKNVTPSPSPASEPAQSAPNPCGDAGASAPVSSAPPAAAETKPVTSSPAAAPASSSGPGQTTKNVRISEQLYIGKSKISDKPYYEVKGEEMVNGRARAGHTWFTQDEQLAKMSASCEGTESQFTITWHLGHLSGAPTTAKPVRILTAIAGA